jgi:hypothetical protein
MMTTATLEAPRPLDRNESGALLGRTMGLVALTAGVFALGAYTGRAASGGWAWLWFIVASPH